MNSFFKKLSQWAVAFAVGFSWAGTTILNIGNPPAISLPATPVIPDCIAPVGMASDLPAMRVALAKWSSCSGVKIDLKNLNQLQASEVAGLKSSASSAESLKSQLCALANPVMNCSLDVLAAVKQIIAPTPKPPSNSCQVYPDMYGWRGIGTDTVNFPIRNPGCDYSQLQLVIDTDLDFQHWGQWLASWRGSPCSVISGPSLNGNSVSFGIYVDPTKFVGWSSGGSCTYKLVRAEDKALVISGSFWIGMNCTVSTPDMCAATGLDLLDYQTAVDVLGCSDAGLQQELQRQTEVMTGLGQPPVVGVRFSDRTWYSPSSEVNPDTNQPDGQVYEVCTWRKP